MRLGHLLNTPSLSLYMAKHGKIQKPRCTTLSGFHFRCHELLSQSTLFLRVKWCPDQTQRGEPGAFRGQGWEAASAPRKPEDCLCCGQRRREKAQSWPRGAEMLNPHALPVHLEQALATLFWAKPSKETFPLSTALALARPASGRAQGVRSSLGRDTVACAVPSEPRGGHSPARARRRRRAGRGRRPWRWAAGRRWEGAAGSCSSRTRRASPGTAAAPRRRPPPLLPPPRRGPAGSGAAASPPATSGRLAGRPPCAPCPGSAALWSPTACRPRASRPAGCPPGAVLRGLGRGRSSEPRAGRADARAGAGGGLRAAPGRRRRHHRSRGREPPGPSARLAPPRAQRTGLRAGAAPARAHHRPPTVRLGSRESFRPSPCPPACRRLHSGAPPPLASGLQPGRLGLQPCSPLQQRTAWGLLLGSWSLPPDCQSPHCLSMISQGSSVKGCHALIPPSLERGSHIPDHPSLVCLLSKMWLLSHFLYCNLTPSTEQELGPSRTCGSPFERMAPTNSITQWLETPVVLRQRASPFLCLCSPRLRSTLWTSVFGIADLPRTLSVRQGWHRSWSKEWESSSVGKVGLGITHPMPLDTLGDQMHEAWQT